jgi:hypothetical protein
MKLRAVFATRIRIEFLPGLRSDVTSSRYGGHQSESGALSVDVDDRGLANGWIEIGLHAVARCLDRKFDGLAEIERDQLSGL